MVAAKRLPRENPILDAEIVERPLSTRGPKYDLREEVEKIAKTVQTGKAIRLRFRSPEQAKRVQMSLRHFVSKKDLVMRYQKDAADRLICWAEKVKSRAGEPAGE